MKHARHPFVFHVFLVRPSKYDDEGFVIRHRRAVVPSNSLACMYGLTEDVRHWRVLGEVDLRIHVVDEAVNKISRGGAQPPHLRRAGATRPRPAAKSTSSAGGAPLHVHGSLADAA